MDLSSLSKFCILFQDEESYNYYLCTIVIIRSEIKIDVSGIEMFSFFELLLKRIQIFLVLIEFQKIDYCKRFRRVKKEKKYKSYNKIYLLQKCFHILFKMSCTR